MSEACPCGWPTPGQEVLPRGAHGLVADGKLRGLVVGHYASRYTRIERKLAELGIEYAELHFREPDGTCVPHGMVWRSGR